MECLNKEIITKKQSSHNIIKIQTYNLHYDEIPSFYGCDCMLFAIFGFFTTTTKQENEYSFNFD
jgi:hypothetical protein